MFATDYLFQQKFGSKKPTSQAIEKSAELAPFRWLFGPENAISAKVLGDFLRPVRPRCPENPPTKSTTLPTASPSPWTHERPDAPQGMPEAAAAVWRDSISSMKARHFSKETHALLARYCHAMAECERLETELDRIGVGLPSYDRLSQRLNSTASTALAYATRIKAHAPNLIWRAAPAAAIRTAP